MATYGYTFNSGDGVTPTRLNDARTISGIVNADIDAAAAIAASKLSTAAQQALVPAGAVMPFAMNSAPSGWLAANGDAVSRSTYAALFSAISTTHGAGDGSTTFNLPDLRGIFVRGSGDQTISGTAYSKAFALKETDIFKAHTHTVVDTNFAVAGAGGGGGGLVSGTVTRTTSSEGGAETRPVNIALLYCIKH